MKTNSKSASAPKVIIALSAAGGNPYLSADNHVNFEKISDLQKKIMQAAKDFPTVNAKGKAIKPPKPLATFTIKRNAKLTPYSKSAEKKGDLKYLSRRATVINTAKTLTERAAVRKMALLTQYDKDAIGDMLAKASALAAKAITKHQTAADKTKAKVKKTKEKISTESNKVFGVSLNKIKSALSAGGIKDKDIIMSKGGMGGLAMLVNLGGDNVISIGKSDATKFRAAKKAAAAATNSSD